MNGTSRKTICIGITICALCVIVSVIIAALVFLLTGVILVASNSYCDALYFGNEELINTVILPDLRNLSQSETYSLLAGRYKLSSEYYLKIEKDAVGIISLCLLKRHFSKDSACLQMGTDLESVVICSPDMRPDCLPSSIVEQYFGVSFWYPEKSTVFYAIVDFDSSAGAGKYLTNTTTTLSAVWYDLLAVCEVVVNLTIAVIFFGVLIFVCCLGCAVCCLRGCCLHCKEKR